MAKSRAKRAHQDAQNVPATKKAKITLLAAQKPRAPQEPTTLSELGLSSDDLDISVDTLNTLAANSGYTKLKVCRNLRTAVFEFRKACSIGVNSTGLSWVDDLVD